MNKKTQCPVGQIYRNAYSRKLSSGKPIKVAGNCIRATSQSGLKRSVIDKKIIAAKIRKQSRQPSKKCPSGQISRVGYRKKSYVTKSGTSISSTNVPSTCIKATGQARITGHKGTQLFVLEKGTLAKYGYENVTSLSLAQRHTALNRALKDIKPLSLYRRINALYVLNKEKNPKVANTFRSDANYIKTTKSYKNRDTIN